MKLSHTTKNKKYIIFHISSPLDFFSFHFLNILREVQDIKKYHYWATVGVVLIFYLYFNRPKMTGINSVYILGISNMTDKV